jgi:hypothetical protein
MEEGDEVLAFLEGLLARYPRERGGLQVWAFLDEEGRWTVALFRGEVLVELDWGYDLEAVEEALWRRYSSSR